MEVKRGRTVAIFFMVAALLVLLVLGLNLARKLVGFGQLRTAPAPTASPPRVTIGVLLYEDGGLAALRVSNLVAGGPAEKCGLQVGDVVRGIAGFSVKTLDDVWGALGTIEPGVKVPLVVEREGNRIHLSLMPQAR